MDNWFIFDAGYGTVYINAVNLTDAREYAKVWRCGRYIGRGQPGKGALFFGTTEARSEQIKRENEARFGVGYDVVKMGG